MNASAEKIFAEQIKILYERAPAVIPVNPIIGGVLAIIIYPVVDHAIVIWWWVTMFVVTMARYAHAKYVLKQNDWTGNVARLRDLFSVFVCITGLIWTAAFFLFAFRVPDVYLIFIILSLGGMAVGAIASMATSKLAYFCYMIPMIAPPVVVFLFEGDVIGYAMFTVLFIYSVSISLTFLQTYKLIQNAIANQFEKDQLIQHMKISNQHLELANEKIMVLSHTDELTQIANRRYLDTTLTREWGRAIRSHIPISFVMIDIDFFKAYNDTFGHQQGDECLQKVSASLREVVKRPGDFIARYGGEEFALILPDTGLEGALQLLDKIREDVQKKQIPAANTSVNAFVTISAGVACIVPTLDNDLTAFVAAADSALYTAKKNGRNQVETVQL